MGSRVKKHLTDGSSVQDLLLFDPAKEDFVTVPDQIIPLMRDLSGLHKDGDFWSVQGNGSLLMSDYLNPSKMIPLPPLTALHGLY